MQRYFDTSALCRYYHPEAGSDQVERWIDEPGCVSLVSWLTSLEVQSAFAMKVRTAEIDESDFAALQKRFKADVRANRFTVIRLLQRHFAKAERLISQHGLLHRLRSLDALHLAISLDLKSRGLLDAFVTADSILADVARKEGLIVQNPLGP